MAKKLKISSIIEEEKDTAWGTAVVPLCRVANSVGIRANSRLESRPLATPCNNRQPQK